MYRMNYLWLAVLAVGLIGAVVLPLVFDGGVAPDAPTWLGKVTFFISLVLALIAAPVLAAFDQPVR